MLNTSSEFAKRIEDNGSIRVKVKVTFANNTVVDITGEDLMSGTVTFEDAVSSTTSFDIGAAIINRCKLTLNNYEDKFSDYDFTGAKIEPYIGVELANGTVEWLKKGVYWTEQPDAYPVTIELTALDTMTKFERPYGEVTTRYPVSLRTIVQDICAKYNVTLATPDFPNYDFTVAERPTNDSLNCLNMIGYVAQCAGCWARMDNEGKLRLGWYDLHAFDGETWLDGGSYEGSATPYSTGDVADGGNFTTYTGGTSYDAATFANKPYVFVQAISSSTIITDDVVITGIRVNASEDTYNNTEPDSKLYGSEGYVLQIDGNPLIPRGKASDVATRVGTRIVGMRFRPFDVSAVGSPAYEAGDAILIVDAKQNSYRSFITSLTYTAGSYEKFVCKAETPSRNSASSYSAGTRAIVQLRDELAKEKSERELALENLAETLNSNAGMYVTKEPAENGGMVYYLHNKEQLADSQYIWKMTAEAVAISVDGGQTYSYGLDVRGNAILERIYTVGLDANYINTGALTVRKGDKITFKADCDTGEVVVDAEAINIDLSSINSQIDASKAHYGYCSTAGATVEKVATCTNFKLYEGAIVCVRFAYKNTAANPTLNVNATGAKPIVINGATDTLDTLWNANDVLTFIYDGTSWRLSDNGAITHLKATKDGILLSVQSDYVSKSDASVYATKHELQVTANEFNSTITALSGIRCECSTNYSESIKTVTIPDVVQKVGLELCVKFEYETGVNYPQFKLNNNYAAGIYRDGELIKADYGWKAGETVTLKYVKNLDNGLMSSFGFWVITDGAVGSQIRQAIDNVQLSVTGSLGGKASISLVANCPEPLDNELDLSKVRNAFANDRSAVIISAGTVSFNSNTFIADSTNFKVTADGTLTANNANLQGTFRCGTSACLLTVADGYIRGTNNGTAIGTIGYTAASQEVNEDGNPTGRIHYGVQITGRDIVRITTPRLSVACSSYENTTTYSGVTAWNNNFEFVRAITDLGDGRIEWSWNKGRLRFINGICVSQPFIG